MFTELLIHNFRCAISSRAVLLIVFLFLFGYSFRTPFLGFHCIFLHSLFHLYIAHTDLCTEPQPLGEICSCLYSYLSGGRIMVKTYRAVSGAVDVVLGLPRAPYWDQLSLYVYTY